MRTFINLQQNINLKQFNTFHIETIAKYFSVLRSTDDISILLSQVNINELSKLILGGGSNILFTKDYDGLVIKNEIKGIKQVFENDDFIQLEVGAGEDWHTFVMYCIDRGYGGIENLSLIPGTVGAAPIQNIGAYGVELKDTFIKLNAYDLQTKDVCVFTNAECKFGYRDSIFKNEFKNRFIILSVIFQLCKKPKLNLQYGEIVKTFKKLQIKELTLKSISDVIICIRRSKLPDPNDIGNAGSFFKNPIITNNQYSKLQKVFPTIPCFSTNDPIFVKVPAAWLIEQCGWKGKRFGDVGVYEKQALILVNYGVGTGEEVKHLATKIKQSVFDKFEIDLITEVNYI